MEDLGAPVAYLVVRPQTPVYDPSGAEVGTVAQVLADEVEDIFHGMIVSVAGPGYRFADPGQLAGLYERGVTLAVPAVELHDPTEDGVAAHAVGTPVREGLRRAVDWVARPR